MLDLSSVSGNGIQFNPSDTSNIEAIVKGFLSNFNFKKLTSKHIDYSATFVAIGKSGKTDTFTKNTFNRSTN